MIPMSATIKRAASRTIATFVRSTAGIAACLVFANLLTSTTALATQYWDTNGSTAGSGNAGGSWAGTNWSTDSTGASSTSGWFANQDAVFSAGTDGTGNLAIDVGAAQNIRNLTVEEGNITLGTSGSLITTGAGGNPVWTVASGSSLAIQRNVTDTAGHLIDFQGGGNTNITGVVSMTGWFGASNSGTGTVELNSSGNSVGRLIVGFGGSGNFKMSGGSLNVTQSTSGYTSQTAAGTTTLTQTGGTLNFNHASSQFFGNNFVSRSNSFTIDASAGSLSMTGASSYFVLNSYGSGVLNMSGTASVTLNKLGLSWDSNAGNSAVVNLNGGTLSIGSIGEMVNGNIQSTLSASTINFGGGTLQARANNGAFLTYVDTLNVKAGGATIDTQNFNVTIANAFASVGGGNDLTKQGAGTLTLSNSAALTAFGSMDVNVQQGTLDLSALSSLPTFSTLKGDGTLAVGSNTATLAAGGSLLPGNSPGVLDVTGDLSVANIADTGGLTFELGDSLIPADNDRVNLTGLLTLGTLNFADFTFAPGSGFGTGVYTLFDAASISGSIGTASGAIGAFTGTLSIDGASNVLLTVVPEPGTFAMLLFGSLMLWAVRRKRK